MMGFHPADILLGGAGPAVVPVLVGPLQALIAALPIIAVAMGSALAALFKPSTMRKLAGLLWAQKVPVIVLAAVIAGAVWAWPRVFPRTMAAAGKAELGSSSWPLWRGSPSRRGYQSSHPDPTCGKVNWSFVDGKIRTFYSSPAVVGNRVYTTSALYEYFRDEGAIYALDAETGALVWRFAEGKYRATFSSPAISGRHLVVGEGLHLTRDGRVFCLDIEKSEAARAGVKLWEYRTKSHVESSPCIAGDRVFIGAGDDGLYCFRLEPDEKGQAVVLWHLDGKKYPDCETSPAENDGRLYFGLGVGGHAVVCVNAADGSEVWRVPTPYPAFGSPAVSKDRVYVGMGTGNYVETAAEVAAKERRKMEEAGKSPAEIEAAMASLAAAGEVWCIDAANGEVKWRFKTGEIVLGSVAAEDDRIYFASRDRHVYCVDSSGALVGKWNSGSPIVTAPASAGSHVYAVTQTGLLYGLDKGSLKPVWSVSLGSQSLSSPAVGRSHVYVGTNEGGLLSVGVAETERREPLWPGRLGGAGRSGWLDGSLIPQKAIFAWRYPEPPEGSEAEEPCSVTAPAAFAGEALYVGLNYAARHGLARLKSGGSGSKPTLGWFVETKNAVVLSAAAHGDDVFFVDGRPGDSGRMLRALRASDGAVVFSQPVENDASGEILMTERGLLVCDGARAISLIPAESAKAGEAPAPLWRRELGPVAGLAAVEGDIAFVAAREPEALTALDLPTGKTLWSRALASAPLSGPVMAGGRLWLAVGEGLTSYDPADGSPGDAVPCGIAAAGIVADAGVLAILNDKAEIVIVNAETREITSRIAGADAGIPPVLAGRTVLYCDRRSIMSYDLASGESRRVLSTSWMGEFTSPLIVVDSQILFGTSKKGFVCAKPGRN